mgnify:CR=1 FL=1
MPDDWICAWSVAPAPSVSAPVPSDSIAVLGEPRTTTVIAGSEYLTFKVWRSFWRRQPGNYRDVHYVRLAGGRVAEHGDIRTLPESVRTQIKE